MIGYSSGSLSDKILLEALQQASAKLMEAASVDELMLMKNNALLVHKITVHDRYKQYSAGKAYHLLVVVIDLNKKREF